MADKKISALTALAAADAAAGDLGVVADIDATETKSMRLDVLLAALARLATSGNLALGSATVGTSGTDTIAILNGTAPTSAPANVSQLYSSDFEAGAGDARLLVRSESGNPVALGNGALAVPKPAAATGASQAGRALTLRASDAVASTDTEGAAAGGGLTLQAGDAKRLTSGNAAGGDVLLLPGNLIGSGTAGKVIVRQPGGVAGTDEVQISHDGTQGLIQVPETSGVIRLRVTGVSSTIYLDATSGVVCGDAGGNESCLISQTEVRARNNGMFSWADDTTPSNGVRDTAVVRAAQRVIGISDGSTTGATLSSAQRAPAQITGDTNDYAPGTARTLRLTSDAAYNITGLVAGVDGQEVRLFNANAADALTLKHENVASAAANRFSFSTGADIALAAKQSLWLWYDATSSRWREDL